MVPVQDEETMRSRFSDYFNHDDDAPEYDRDVANERNPIRTGYADLIAYVGARVSPGSRVLELGTGTGNTILHLPDDTVVTGVDVSAGMLAIAESKLRGRNVTLIQDDVLNYVTGHDLNEFDIIVSTYALHHLTLDERETMFSEIARKSPGTVRVIVGDLMYENEADKSRIISLHHDAFPGMADDFDDEFFWDVESSEVMLKRTGWVPAWKRFSDLSWVGEFRRA
ncbi:MAG: class I SAM-dependent methyltransferase, partial [Spirochaetaceae bacterium]